MAPAYSADLNGGLDLTPYVLKDEGWKIKGVIIDGCDSGAENRTLPASTGYRFLHEMVDQCAASAKNHGQFVKCVNHTAKDLRDAGFITQDDRNGLQRCAAQADIP
jgi:hypothetical protein